MRSQTIPTYSLGYILAHIQGGGKPGPYPIRRMTCGTWTYRVRAGLRRSGVVNRESYVAIGDGRSGCLTTGASALAVMRGFFVALSAIGVEVRGRWDNSSHAPKRIHATIKRILLPLPICRVR